jgi:hypothetical protein
VLTVIKLWLVQGQTLFAIGWAAHDDRLFLNLAESLLKGNWLGQYNCLTLAKGCFYPIWIAFAFWCSIPLLLAQHLLYISACLLLVAAVSPRLKSPVILALIYVILIFNPMEYASAVLRVIRDGIYPALTILVIAGALGIIFRWDHSLKSLTGWSILFGCALSAFWLTREEGVWIMPIIFLCSGFTIYRVWKASKAGRIIRLTVCCILPFVIWGAALFVISATNWFHYGIWGTVEFKSRDFLAAYGALTRVKHTNWTLDVPVPKETRLRIYSVSPAFAQLEKSLEGASGERWVKAGGSEEVRGGWFVWALRDAVNEAGFCSSAGAALNYYRRLAMEVNSACDEGRLECGPEMASLMPPFHTAYVRPVIKAFLRGMAFLVKFQGFDPNPPRSLGSDDQLVLFRDLTNERLSSSVSGITRYAGWVFSPYSPLRLSVYTGNGVSANAFIKNMPCPDLCKVFESRGIDTTNAREARFKITALDCGTDCYLQVESLDGRLIKRIYLDGQGPALHLDGPEVFFHLDSRTEAYVFPNQARWDSKKIRVLSYIGKIYQTLTPVLFLLALAVYVLTAIQVFRKRKNSDIFFVNTALLMAILGRVFILALIEVTSFPVIDMLYLSSAYPLISIFTLLAPIDQLERSKRHRVGDPIPDG